MASPEAVPRVVLVEKPEDGEYGFEVVGNEPIYFRSVTGAAKVRIASCMWWWWSCYCMLCGGGVGGGRGVGYSCSGVV